MKKNILNISDYYPISFDMQEKMHKAALKPEKVNLNAKELSSWALENKLDTLQILILLVKNAFEGHVFHINKISPSDIVESGTFQINLESEKNFRELVSDFYLDFKMYDDGIGIAFKNLKEMASISDKIDYDSLIYFILAYQLFRLPVSYFAGEFDPSRFTIDRREQIKLQFILNHNILHHVAHRFFIDMVNDQYLDKFRKVLFKIQSKEHVLMQLATKLDFANDPVIQNEEMLERKYFEFLVATSTTAAESRKSLVNPELQEAEEERITSKFYKGRVKKIYKAISKNCSEVHTMVDGRERYPGLSQLFMEASAIYNDFTTDFSSLVLQHSRLFLLLIRVINTRKINRLPVMFFDFTGFTEHQPFNLSQEDIFIIEKKLKFNLEIQQIFLFIDYKIKYIKDDEMAAIHAEYLSKQAEFIESRIQEINNEIEQVMGKKIKTSASL